MDLLIEESIYLVLLDLVDKIFESAEVKTAENPEFEDKIDEDVLPDPEPSSAPEVAPIPPRRPLAVTPNLTVTSGRSRYRLGVNAGAHEQIVRLRSTVEVITNERDIWRQRSREQEVKIRDLDLEIGSLEARITALSSLLRFHRARAMSKVNFELGPDGDGPPRAKRSKVEVIPIEEEDNEP